MIQRLQSLYLLMTTLMSLLFLKGSFLTFIDKSGSVIKLTMSGIYRYSETTDPVKLGEVWPLLVLSVLIPVISLVIIFLFRKRNYQLLIARILILLIISFITATFVYAYLTITNFETAILPGIKMVIPVIQIFLVLLANRGIRKDDELVRSYDRLR